MERSFFGSPLPVMLVDRSLRMVFASSEAFERCAQWNFGARARELNAQHVFRVPAQIARACMRLGESAKRIGGPGESECVMHSDGSGLAARIDICLPLEDKQMPAGFLVQFVSSAIPAPDRDARDARADRLRLLSPSERRVALLVANGASNKSVARQLRKSERTVECQMTAIYRKLEVANRVQLCRLLIRDMSQ